MALLEPPYIAVYITSTLSDDLDGYDELNDRMVKLSEEQPGYLGRESLPGKGNEERVVIYWADEESLKGWRLHPEHQVAMRAGRERYYLSYDIRVARVEREYGFRGAAAG
ncbi:antibiotic biosynthesis monooxygenase [Actinomadura kijaniata]|uniref:Heme-degrading monooxygenase HmoA n=1 Tax=Actinomadura namibiensis TaxID=182080 RepID=A0A7W3LTH5_ACTNM|nr:antibiotic biosynthesis monooxygenase [Actinomadura namibiensis]MBA8954004.1 heme-degrading monooxygenase HmoA [Actinomadura namibiensis]